MTPFDRMPGRPRVRGHRHVGGVEKQFVRNFAFSATTITMLAVSVALAVASAAAQAMAQAQAAKQQQQYQNAQQQARDQQIQQNYALSIATYNRETTQLQERQRQADEGAVQKDQESSLQAARAGATARVSAGEAGVAGASVDALMGDFMAQEARYRESVYSNLENQRSQTNAEILGSQQKAEGRAQSIQPYVQAPIKQPDYAGLAIGAAASSYGAIGKPPGNQDLRSSGADVLPGGVGSGSNPY